MIHNTRRAAAEARALTMALTVAAKAGWRFERGPLPTTSFAQFLYVEAAHLLLVPTSAALPFAMRQVDPVVRETRSDALIVSSADADTPVFAMAVWARRETVWTQPLAAWLGEAGELWLVPDADDTPTLAFRLVDALHHAASVPWNSASERRAGLDRAAAWMRKEVE
jgi:hypothetical protein